MTLHPAWLTAAVALALYLFARRRAHGRAFTAAGAVAAAGAGLVGLGVVELPDAAKVIEDVGTALGSWTYLLVGVLAYLETGAFVGLIAPGETTVIVGGLVAGQGRISLPLLIAIVWTCAVAGDLTSYFLGRRLGREFLVRHGGKVKITEGRLEQVEGFFERHGGMTILVGRFVGLVRALAPFVAGASRMPLHRFLPFDVLGAGAWSATFCVLGYVFWRSFDQLTTWVSRGLFALGLLLALVVGIAYAVRLQHSPALRARTRRWVAAQLASPALRPVAPYVRAAWQRVLRPLASHLERPARFLWHRLTPGDLGLEVTSMLALTAVGGFVFGVGGHFLSDRELMPLDRGAFELGARLHSERAVDVVVGLTALGSSPVVGAVVLICALWAARRGRGTEAAVLVGAFLATLAAVHIAKAGFARPRPAGGYVATLHMAYPSGHAAYAVAWAACAVVIVRVGCSPAVRVAAAAAAVVLVAVVGLSRVYLRAHYLSDVIGGIALGVAIFALSGVIAAVVGRLRQNHARDP